MNAPKLLELMNKYAEGSGTIADSLWDLCGLDEHESFEIARVVARANFKTLADNNIRDLVIDALIFGGLAARERMKQ